MDKVKSEEGLSKHYMIGGDGPNSYSQNSEYQKQLLVSVEDLIIELTNDHLDIEKPPFDPQNTFRIADFGCSVGPNAIFAIENIIAAIENKYLSNQKNPIIPEFQVFFNDLVGNDFNTLFQNLPPKRRQIAAATPGSFHGRLFPNATLHFAHCSTSLHWLSKVPKELTEMSSSAWNKGKIHYIGAAKEVREAYFDQYKEDMKAFLDARANELVDDGLMALVILGYPDEVLSSGTGTEIIFSKLESCLEDMAKIGKITEEKVESFNLPFYFPWPSELKAMIEENGLFCIERISRLATPVTHKPDPQFVSSHLRAVTGELIEQHFGNEIIEDLFRGALEKIAKSPLSTGQKVNQEANYFILLKRKTRLEENALTKCHDNEC